MLKRWRTIRWLLVIATFLAFVLIDYFKISFSPLYVILIFLILFAFTTFKIYMVASQADEDFENDEDEG